MLQDKAAAAENVNIPKAKQPAQIPSHRRISRAQSEAKQHTGLQSGKPFRPTSVQPSAAAPAANASLHADESASKLPAAAAASPAYAVQTSHNSVGSLDECHSADAHHSQAAVSSEQPLPGPLASVNFLAADRHAVSLTAQPELYQALYAAVTAIVQQAGLPPTQPTQRSTASNGSQTKPEAQGQPQEVGTRSGGQLQHQKTPDTASSQDEPSQNRGYATGGAMGKASDGPEGNASEGTMGNAKGELQAWQSQIQQAMDVLQSTLHAPGKSSGLSAVLNSSQHPGTALLQSTAVQSDPVLAQQQDTPHSQQAAAPSQADGQPQLDPAEQTSQHTQRAQHGGFESCQPPQCLDPEADWPQAWPQRDDAPLRGQTPCHRGHTPLQMDGHQHGSAAEDGRQQSSQHGHSSIRVETSSQQAAQPCEHDQWYECGHARWQSQAESPCQHQLPEKKRPGGAQRRLYKHGPALPGSAAGKGSVRRRQRPEWDDHLTSTNPHNPAGFDGDIGGCSSRPTAKELLQEALARIQNVSSPRPQHVKRQRRGAAPSQPTVPKQYQATAVDKQPQLQCAKAGGDQQKSGHSCSAQDAAARGPQRAGSVQTARQQQSVAMQAAAKQSLVKQHAFGGKPTWVDRNSDQAAGFEQDAQAMQPGKASQSRDSTHQQIPLSAGKPESRAHPHTKACTMESLLLLLCTAHLSQRCHSQSRLRCRFCNKRDQAVKGCCLDHRAKRLGRCCCC